MDQVPEYEVKPQDVSKEVLKEQIKEYVDNFEEYKKLDKMMKQYEANIKEYMIKNEISTLKSKGMTFNIIARKCNVLDRSLIPNIKQYYADTTRMVLSKFKTSGKEIDLK